ncbi:MAG: hypothetical protein PVI79_11675 [Gammaproteobacteria bacterium]|jgi:hypothetical protein
MFKGKLKTGLIVLMSIFISAVSMQAQAWSYGVSWYSEINFTFGAKGNKLKLANGNYVVSEIYAFNYVSKCIATNSGQLTLHTGLGNNGNGDVISPVVKENSDGSGKNKGTFSATGTLSLQNMYQHYELTNEESGDGSLNCYAGDGSPLNAPTGLCTEADRNALHTEHFCHAEADQKVEYKDNLYFPQIAVWVRVVEGNDDGTPPQPPYNVVSQGIAECVYTGDVTEDIYGEFVTTTVPTDCDVTEYPLSVEDPRFVHVLSF